MGPMYTVFKSPRHYYLFDGNISKIVSVDKEMFDSLKRILCIEAVEQDHAQLGKLQEHGICLETKLVEIEHPETSLISSYFDNMLGGICLQVTQNCNLRCSYCPYSGGNEYHNRHHSNSGMSLNTAIKAVDFYFTHAKNSKRHQISFYGGEPLLEMDLLQSVVQYVHTHYSNINVSFPITTNATLLTDSIVDFLVTNNFAVTISLDGPEEYHNQNRTYSSGKGSYESVIANLLKFKNRYPEFYTRISFNSVVVPQNDYGKYISFFYNSSVTKDNIFSLAKLSPNYTDDVAQYSDDFFVSCAYERLGGMLWSIGAIQLDHTGPLTAKWLAGTTEKYREIQNTGCISQTSHPGGPCIPGKDKLFIDIHGDFYPCERVSEESLLMKIGNLDTGIDLEKIKKIINVGQCTANTCKSCWCFSHCIQCAAYADDLSNEWSAEKRLSNCNEVKLTMLSQLRDICFLMENDYNFYNRIIEI